MASELTMASADVVNTMKDLIAKYHPHLASIVDDIAIIFKEKAGSAGEKVVAGKTSKANPVVVCLADKPWKFVITLAADVWSELDDKQKLALLDHHLCGIKGSEDDQSGEMKFFLQPPDVEFYKEEVERHGLWRTSGVPPSTNLITEIFGA
jgi:hypothetical protein